MAPQRYNVVMFHVLSPSPEAQNNDPALLSCSLIRPLCKLLKCQQGSENFDWYQKPCRGYGRHFSKLTTPSNLKFSSSILYLRSSLTVSSNASNQATKKTLTLGFIAQQTSGGD
ncbi:hypothetical protein MLD38_011557 [Melastoma candidum]|uniref:Uncharacterized protein n=1 Tax=Melastoma candidum TaxID=119954 RepID=A0ACB9R6G3_9MYRT|nr:hypothetical protein MLD38_011557 [Melastoma candidum]